MAMHHLFDLLRYAPALHCIGVVMAILGVVAVFE